MSNVGRPMLCPVYDMLWAGSNGAGPEGGFVSHLQQRFQLRGGRRLRPNTSEIVFGVLRCTRGRPSEIIRKYSPRRVPTQSAPEVQIAFGIFGFPMRARVALRGMRT